MFRSLSLVQRVQFKGAKFSNNCLKQLTTTYSNQLNTNFEPKPFHFRHFCVDTGSSEHIKKLVDSNKVVLFMKGTPDEPMCGFSKAVVQILSMHGVEYDSHNILEDMNLRSGIKSFSDWPTIPQVYINGEFVGGCDIMLQMHQNGELVDELKNVGIKSALVD